VTHRLAGVAAVAAAAAFVAGCGGSSEAAPREDPAQVMRAVVTHELAGERALSYRMLVREQRAAVSPSLYKRCSPGPTLEKSGVTVGVVGVRDEQFSVPALGKRKTKAVSYRIDFHDGTAPIASTGHLIAEDGHWRWTLSPPSFDSLSGGSCP
jgi:hypothetical protein